MTSQHTHQSPTSVVNRRAGNLPVRMVHEKFAKACQAGRLHDAVQIFDVAASLSPIDVDRTGTDRKTALFHAIVGHSAPVVRYLVFECQADVTRRSFVFFRVDCSAVNFESCDEPPVVTAARAGTTEILLCLLQNGADANDRPELANHHRPDGGGGGGGGGGGCIETALGPAGRGKVVHGGSALHFACEAGNLDMVRLLLQYGADVNAVDHKMERPLHLAVRCKMPLCADQRMIVELLCEHGAEVDATNKKDCSPLYLAALYGCTSKVETLLLFGASPNAVSLPSSSSGGYGSPLHVAAYKDRLPLAALLVAHGACINRRNGNGLSPLQVNIAEHCRSEIAPLLVYHGARLDGRDKSGRTLLGTCIGNLRLDCESLAVLMVQAGYDLSDDRWLVPGYAMTDGTSSSSPPVEIPDGRVRKLCDWLRTKQETPRSLGEACRVVIRRRLSTCADGRTLVPAIYQLPLPTAIKNFLLLKNPAGSNIERPILSFLHSIES